MLDSISFTVVLVVTQFTSQLQPGVRTDGRVCTLHVVDLLRHTPSLVYFRKPQRHFKIAGLLRGSRVSILGRRFAPTRLRWNGGGPRGLSPPPPLPCPRMSCVFFRLCHLLVSIVSECTRAIRYSVPHVRTQPNRR